ncbi:MAG: nucleotide exchange factor GrpE [Firmicutes bacterium]|nr:nucleotide exchange factor GrpE [Bacillota bacterium]
MVNEEVKTNEKVKKVVKKANKANLEIEKLILEKAELSDKVLRLTAEMQNMSRRFEQEKTNIFKYDGEKLIKELLPIVDNFERAIRLDDDNLSDELSKFLTGFKMIYTSLVSTLKAVGVSEIEALGKEFDPNKMEAIMTTNIMEEEQNVVVEVMQKGYMYNDKVIRVAMVKVNE